MSLIARFPLPVSLGGPTPPTLSSWQFQYNGVTLGPGTSYGYTKVTGMNLASVRSGDVDLPRDHGQLIGLDVYGGRDITMDLWMTGSGGLFPNQLALATAMQILQGGATETPLWFQIPTQPLTCVMAKPRKRDMVWDAEYAAGGRGEPMVSFHCTDPRIYAAGQSTTIPLVSAGGGGLGPFPVGPFPVTFGQSSGTTTTINNAGNMETRPIVIFNGPSTNPFISNLTTSGTLRFQNPSQSSFTVLSGDQLVVDLGEPHRILYYQGGVLSGSTPVAEPNWIVQGSTWWDLLAGNNSIQYGTQDTTTVGIGSAQIVWASAWQF